MILFSTFFTFSIDDGFQISGLSQISTDILHSLLLSIRNSNLISHNDFQLILTVVRSGSLFGFFQFSRVHLLELD